MHQTMRKWGVWTLLGLAAVTFSAPARADYASAVSAFRKQQGLKPVQMDSRLTALALEQARAMAAQNVVNHTAAGPFEARVGKLRRAQAAENVAAGFLTFDETLQQWKDSAGHRENLLIPGARKIGVASAANPKSKYRMFWAMVITE